MKIGKKLGKRAALLLCSLFLFGNVAEAAVPAFTNVNGIYYNDKGEVIKGAIAKGIDVSWHQGAIDWAKVKETDIDFALIRCGYGDDMESQDDVCFAQNVQGCEENGIPYGIYLYSYAINEEMIASEVAHTLRLLQTVDAKPTYPIYLDIEDESLKIASMTPKRFADLAEIYCTEMEKAGYKAGVYANYEFWTTYLTDSRFDGWYRWVARHNSTTSYKNPYDMWQYTNEGTIAGIAGNVDVNILLARGCSLAGHTWTVKTLLQKATTTKDGRAVYRCKACGHEKTDKIAKAKTLTLSKQSYTYSGKANKPAVKVIDGDGKAIPTASYTTSYKNNSKPGYGTVQVTLKGNYQGILKATFTIAPRKVTGSKVTNVKGKKMKVTWKKESLVQGYEICYATNTKFTKNKKTVTVQSSAKSKTISKLKKKTYYVRVRAFAKVNGKKVYGTWSQSKKVQIKR